MYIDTLTHEGIKKSLCEIFNMNEIHLKDAINHLRNYDNYDEQIKEIDYFIKQHLKYKPNELLFFHLSRRLNTMIDENDGKPLSVLLTTNNPFSNFFKKYYISFEMVDNRLVFKYKNNNIDLNFNAAAKNIENRILHDDCFNGQAFNINITSSIYNYSLEECPEIINDISNIISKNINMIDDYKNNSTYICYIYKVPIDYVIVDNKEYYEDKLYSLLRKCIEILFEDGYMKENIVLRIEDGKILSSKYFMNKYVIKLND